VTIKNPPLICTSMNKPHHQAWQCMTFPWENDDWRLIPQDYRKSDKFSRIEVFNNMIIISQDKVFSGYPDIYSENSSSSWIKIPVSGTCQKK